MMMYDETDENIQEEEVYASVICNVCDMLAAQKIIGTAGHSADVNPCPWCHCQLVDANLPAGYSSNNGMDDSFYDLLY